MEFGLSRTPATGSSLVRNLLVRTGSGVLAAVVTLGTPALAQVRLQVQNTDIASAGRPFMRVFTDRDGLPQNVIEAIAFDARKYLWVGTQDGAAYYNGRTWTTLDMPNPLVSNWVRAIVVARDGAIWFGRDDGGVARYAGGSFEVFDATRGLPHGRVLALAELSLGGQAEMWAGTSAGLAVLHPPNWEVPTGIPPALRVPVLAIVPETDANGVAHTIWVGTEQGLAKFRDGTWRVFTTDQGLPSPVVQSVLPTRDEHGNPRLYVGTSDGLAILDETDAVVWSGKAGLPHRSVSRLLETRDEQGGRILWVGTEGGLARADAQGVRVLGARSGLPNGITRSLAVAGVRGGRTTVWVGTFGGLARLVSGTWTTFGVDTGLPDNVLFALDHQQAADRYWFGTFGGGIARFEGGVFRLFDASDGLPDPRIFSMAHQPDAEGEPRLWVGTRGGGAVEFDGERFVPRPGLADPWVYSILPTRDAAGQSVVWAGTRHGLSKYADGAWHDLRVEGFPDVYVTSLREVHTAGRTDVWVGTRGRGVARLRDDSWAWFAVAEGVAHPRVSFLREMRLGGRRVMAIGTMGGGMTFAELDAEPLEFWSVGGGPGYALPSELVYASEQDRQGRIYAFTHRGVTQLKPLRPSPRGEGDFEARTFTTGDGLPSNGCTQASTMVDGQGRLWTGTVSGVAMFDPSEATLDETPKPLYIEKALVGGRRHDFAANPRIRHDHGGIVFEYALLSYYRESDTRYRTQLVGLEASPSDWVPDPKREYPSLPDGSYVFRVWGRDDSRNVTGPVEVNFEIAPSFWRSKLAFGGYGLLLVFGLFGVVRLRVAVLQKRNKELRSIVAARTNELEHANQSLRELSHTDPLTGLRNRRFLQLNAPMDAAQVLRTRRDIVEKMLNRVVRNTDIVWLMVDVDHFKRVNDAHGHTAGDRVLIEMANILRAATRASDTIVRWGGEEFLVFARSTSREEAHRLAERIRELVSKAEFDVGEGHVVHLTCSIGFAPFPFFVDDPTCLNWEQTVALADQALYAAKRAGRDAWVGLLGAETVHEGANTPPPWSIKDRIADGSVVVQTSQPDPDALPWSE